LLSAATIGIPVGTDAAMRSRAETKADESVEKFLHAARQDHQQSLSPYNTFSPFQQQQQQYQEFPHQQRQNGNVLSMLDYYTPPDYNQYYGVPNILTNGEEEEMLIKRKKLKQQKRKKKKKMMKQREKKTKKRKIKKRGRKHKH
jgi:hypothetical protein